MNSFLLGILSGVILALLNFFGSILVSHNVSIRSKKISLVLILGGFVTRLAMLSLLFYGLSQLKAFHLHAALVSFIAVFTVCLILKGIKFYREVGSLTWKPYKG